MPFLVKENITPKQLAPAGTHVARCVGLVALGTHTGDYQGKPVTRTACSITWELPLAKRDDGKPHLVSEKFTVSLGEKSKLRSFLGNWNGVAFTEETAKEYDLETILGRPALLSLIKQKKTSGEDRITVASASQIPEGFVVPPQVTPTLFYTLDMGENETFKKLPQWIQEQIKTSLEWNRGKVEALKETHSSAAEQEGRDHTTAEEDVPF